MTCICHEDREILLVIYEARKMVYLHSAVSRAAYATLISWCKRLALISGFSFYTGFS